VAFLVSLFGPLLLPGQCLLAAYFIPGHRRRLALGLGMLLVTLICIFLAFHAG